MLTPATVFGFLNGLDFHQQAEPGGFSGVQRVVLWVLWLTYGSFYFAATILVWRFRIEAELG